jgi:sulfide:quinone oxidoreductase
MISITFVYQQITKMKKAHQIVIIGAGNAGLSVASQLLLQQANLDIAIIDPAQHHYYQPAWTLVGGGVFDVKKTQRSMASVMPEKVNWIQDRVMTFEPDQNQITLGNGDLINYDMLVVAPGIQLNWHEIKGLTNTLGKNGVCSNYSYEYAPYTFECIQKLNNGKAIFHNPHTPVKCGGAPHKIMYLAADYWRNHNRLSQIQIDYHSGGTKLFAVAKYEKTLLEVVKRGGIQLHFFEKLEEIDGENKRARFVGFGETNKEQSSWLNFDMIHVTPPQSAPDFVKNSPLANSAGWVDVDKYALHHPVYTNIFSIGDASGLPTSKTGAAIRKQAPIAVQNIISLLARRKMTARYNGYTSCPLVTGYGKLVLAEFDYNNEPMETFPFDQSKERWSMYQLKKQVLPWLYWNKILKGKA